MKEVAQKVAYEGGVSNKKPEMTKLARFKGLISKAGQIFRYEQPKGTGDFVGGKFEEK